MSGKGELALVGGGLNRPTASERFTGAAWRLLTGERENSQRAVEAIRANPEALEEIRREWRALQAAIEPAGDGVVHACLLEAATLYGSPWDNEDLAAVGMARYFKVLSELPAEAVHSGFDEYDRLPDSRFFPRPGQLLALCQPTAMKLRIAAGRAKMAKDRPAAEAPPTKSPEDRERERAALIAAGHMNPDGTFKPLQFKAMPEPARTKSYRPAKALGNVLAKDPHLQALRESPIARGARVDDPPEEFT